jgi:hypothetical protein
MANPADAVLAATGVLADAAPSAAAISVLDETALLALQAALSAHRRALDALASLTAGEIAHRSRRELGYNGLAQSNGFRSAEEFIQSVSGTTRVEAGKLVHLGSVLLAEAVAESPTWSSAVSAAMSVGDISADAAEAILRGLGGSDAAITPLQLSAAADQLLAAARTLGVDQLYRRARELRDQLDQEGISNREKLRRDLRYLRVSQRPDGMVGGSFLLDQEDGALLTSALDAALSPRRGGPRFVDAATEALAAELIADPRTNDQLAADTLMDILRLAVDADPGAVFGFRRPAVRVIVTEDSLRRRGSGAIEGMPDPIAFGTVERHLCDTGVLGIRFDSDGGVLNVGRDQRLFTERQRVALAVRDGGCLFPDCGRPPSHCEAHHINQWHRDTGRTDLQDGVLLCRFHHLLVHNNEWEVKRDGARFRLVPPRAVDPTQAPIALASNTRAVRELVSG